MASFNQIVGLTFAFVAIYFISESEGLKCFVGTYKDLNLVNCSGSCFTDLYIIPSMNKMGCSKGHSRMECVSMGAMSTCFCNTDFCNFLSSGRLRFRQNGILVKQNREDRRKL